MRVTLQYQSRILMQQMAGSQSRIAALQNQIASGKQLLKSADDPIGAGKSVVIDNTISQLQQYERNNNYALNRLQSEETAIESMNNTLMSIRELALRSNNDSLHAKDQATLLVDLQFRKQEFFGLVNTKGANGEYLFSGTRRTVAPYASIDNHDYQGNNDKQLINTSPNNKIPIGTSAQVLLKHTPDGEPGSVLTLIDDLETLISQAASDSPPDDFQQRMATILASLETAQTHISVQRSEVGHRMVSQESSSKNNADLLFMMQTEQDNLEGLDYPAAISKLETEAQSLQAIQSTYARMSDLSLFNYL